MAKNKIDENDPDTFVVSRLNGKKYLRIGYNHVSKYGYTLDTYMEKFNLTKDDIISKILSKSLAFTLEVARERYGDEEGLKRWNEYCSKQAESNTFEYKNKKYGMSEEEFKKYNLSRSVTLENLIKRHGTDEGTAKWKEYCERQAYAGCSVEYFKEKYGDDTGVSIYNAVCKSKAITLENMMRVHGTEEGTKRYNSWLEVQRPAVSAISLKLFDKVKTYFPNNKIYYGREGSNEYVVYDNETKRAYLYDYVDITVGKCIEFNGDMFHGNPKFYKEYDTPNCYNRSLTSKDLWEADRVKIECLKRLRGIDTLVIWENEFRTNEEETLNKCIEFINREN